MIKAVLFDWGGVLVSGGRSFGAYLQERIGAQVTDVAAFRTIRVALNKGKITEAEFEQKLLAIASGGKIPEKFWEPADIITLLPEMAMFCDQLRSQGLQLGIISNMNARLAQAIEDAGGYNDFSPLLLSCREGVMKPEPEIFDRALQQLSDITPDEIIFIDDLEANLEYPQETGMHTVLAKNTQQIIKDVNQLLGEA